MSQAGLQARAGSPDPSRGMDYGAVFGTDFHRRCRLGCLWCVVAHNKLLTFSNDQKTVQAVLGGNMQGTVEAYVLCLPLG